MKQQITTPKNWYLTEKWGMISMNLLSLALLMGVSLLPVTAAMKNQSNRKPVSFTYSNRSQVDIPVKGKITDRKTGETLIGVSVKVKGAKTGVSSDGNGNYSINAPANGILTITYIGYETLEVPINNRGLVDISLVGSNTSLDEVVVIGYGTQKKINLTGAVSTVDSKVFDSRPIANIGKGLQGTISNLNISQSDGSLGKGASFNVRGNTSINGGSPLILVNGIPMDINLLNPSDIDNVTVLKDAASAAIYGARAAYGVILVTTKSGGMKDKPIISISSNYSINSPTIKFETMDAMERMSYMNEGNMRVNGTPYYQFDQYYAAAITAHYNDPSKPEVFQHPNESPTSYAFSANTDWAKETLRNSFPQQQNTASIRGGSDKFNYYTSFSSFYEEGVAKNFDEKYKRYNFMTNLSYNLNKWFNVGTRISINTSKKTYPPNDASNNFAEDRNMFQTHQWPNWPVYLPDGNYASLGSVPNLVQMQKEGGYRTRNIGDSWLTGFVKLTPVKHMSFNLDYSFNAKNTAELDYRRQLPMFDRAGLSGYYPYTNPSSVTRTNYDNKYYVFNAYTDYENTFAKKHYFKAMVGLNQENDLDQWFQTKREKLMVGTIPQMNLASGERYAYDGAQEYAIRGAFSRLNYSFDDRYLFEFNGRYDGTSKFAKKDRFAFFPSVSAGWRVDNEAFFTGLKKSINMLKFRGSYGNLGNQNVPGYYPYIATFSTGAVNYLINGDAPMTAFAPGLVSPTLTWETVTQRNFGVDFAVLDNRLSGSFDIYRRDTKKMLTKSQTLPAVLAVAEPQSNAADMKTTGFDLTLNWNHTINKVRYGVTFLLGDYKAEILKYSNPSGIISDYYVGQNLGAIWGMETGGFFKTDVEAAALDQKNISGRKRQAGDIWFVDQNGDNKIARGKQTLEDHGDMKIIGNNTPRYSFGFRPNISWKGFDLDIFMQGVAKRDMWISGMYFLDAYNNEWGIQGKIISDYWSPTNLDAQYPRPLVTGGTDVQAVQTRFLQNAAYMRLKQLTFAYTIPLQLSKKLGVQRMKVYFSGNNLWEATKMVKIVDPEQNSAISYPLNRSLSFGANFDF